MNIGKRFDRMKQWTDERMGKEIKTAASDEFKALELEMQLRHEGMPCWVSGSMGVIGLALTFAKQVWSVSKGV